MLKLKRRGKKEWEFVHPDGYDDTLDLLGSGCDLLEVGDYGEAEKAFKDIINEMPDHLDAIHHLALVYERTGRLEEAGVLWEKAVAMARKAYPAEFVEGKDLLPWLMIDNRPFLRCLHGVACIYRDTGRIEEANDIFLEMLRFNPGDNQGIRALVIQSFFMLGKPLKVLEICEEYPNDGMPETLYGKTLACFQAGDKKRAGESLALAIELLPKVAKAIVKKTMRAPKNINPGYITVGGDDEAYEFRMNNRCFWEETNGAIEWMEDKLKGIRGQGHGKAEHKQGNGGIKISKKMRKQLRELAWTAYRRETELALDGLYNKFSQWKKKKISEFEMNELIHSFHDGISRDLWKHYAGHPVQNEFLVADALVRDILTDEDVPGEIREKLSSQIKFYKELS
ncbi:MAG: tetratricopeptide repeat protein [Candidatus Omnitrophota bacterium]|nr:tetratricopeptide repeat protein [Candidatus Omnitrophota bacterium]